MISSLLASAAATDPLPQSPPSNSVWMPLDASTFAAETDGMYNFILWISVVSAALIYSAMVYFVIKYRAKGREENEIGEATSTHNTALEITWSVIPLFFCIAIFVGGFKGYVNLRTPPKDAIEIHVQGQKWKWLFTYPNGLVTSDLHVPVDRDVRIIIQSVDVLHSLYIPAFRTKMDAVPGRYTDLWFRATKEGEYPVFCAEYCGTAHSDMLTTAVVHAPGGYETWLKEKEAELNDLPPAELGAKLYAEQGCSTCHSVDGSAKIGPTWKGIWDTTRTFTDGSTATVDENYIIESINNPAAKVVQGYTPSMPTYQGKLNDRQLNGFVEYIKTLK